MSDQPPLPPAVISNVVAITEFAEGTQEDHDARLAMMIRELRGDMADTREAIAYVATALEDLKTREARLERTMATVLRALIRRRQ